MLLGEGACQHAGECSIELLQRTLVPDHEIGPLFFFGEIHLRRLATRDLARLPSTMLKCAALALRVGYLDEHQVVAFPCEAVLLIVLEEERNVECDAGNGALPGVLEGGHDPVTNTGVDPAFQARPGGGVLENETCQERAVRAASRVDCSRVRTSSQPAQRPAAPRRSIGTSRSSRSSERSSRRINAASAAEYVG